jgi:hypothetical protein
MRIINWLQVTSVASCIVAAGANAVSCVNFINKTHALDAQLKKAAGGVFETIHIQPQASAKLHCSWRQPRHDDLVYTTIVECVSDQGEIYGRVQYARTESSWDSFKQGAYCGSGSGFVSEEAAMQCIDWIYNTTPLPLTTSGGLPNLPTAKKGGAQ